MYHIQLTLPKVLDTKPKTYCKQQTKQTWDFQKLPMIQLMPIVELENEGIVNAVACPNPQVDREEERLEKDEEDTTPNLEDI